MAESVVSLVVESLGDLLVQEAKFLKGVRKQMEQMKTEFVFMKAYLKDADKKQIIDETVRTYVSKIREAAYDAEDVIETFALKIESRRREGSILSALERYACAINCIQLHQVGSEIEAINTRIKTLNGCCDTYGIQRSNKGEEGTSSVVERQRKLRQSFPHVDHEEYTVGLDGDIKNLVERLLNEEKQCQVVSICGMGGLGKTTLAKKVYHHQDIRCHFDGFAWVFLSQQFQPRNIWEGILCDLISASEKERKRIKKLVYEQVAEELHEVQKGKKCLVIIDDIWSPGDWDILRPAFPVGNASSKILLTSRHEEVAVHVDPRGYLHKPQFLTVEEGWSLLQKKAFPGESDGEIDEGMKNLGAEMVKGCSGLPLAIVVLGGILATKRKDEWEMVNNHINSHLLNRGKGSEMREILALSYYELPYQLKPCFLYLGHFPKDFNIPTKKLVRMWVAEGLVSPTQHEGKEAETLEEIAECYLEELVNRNMVQVGERGSTGRVKTCRLHDLMREVCLSKANEENFLKVFYNQDGNELMGGSLSSKETNAKLSHQIRRIAIQFKEIEDENFSLKGERTRYLRSLLFSSAFEYSMCLEKMIFELCSFKLLKVLDLEAGGIGMLPRAIGDLIHLRYLNFILYGGLKVIIPSSIGNLRCLQTLIINNRFTNNVIEVPNIIWKMEQLRYLCLPSCLNENSVRLELGNLRELQTLKNLDARNFDVKELTELTNLRKLRIVSLRSLKELEGVLLISPSDSLNIGLRSLHIEFDSRSLIEKIEDTDLQRLYSSCHQLRKLHLEEKILKLPAYYEFPPNLTKLSLMLSRLEEDPMATLEKLPNLTVLRLLPNAFAGKKMTCSANNFPQLKSLQLLGLHDLEEWYVQREAMRSLCKLEINYCDELKMVPDGLRFITTLRELHIIRMPVVFEERVKEGGKDYDKLKHVPSIIVK